MQKRGKFIVFEGIDGCGKSTQIKKCSAILFDMSKDFDVYMTREPTRDFTQLREVMRIDHRKDTTTNAEWYAEMFIRDRKQHVDRYIMPALERGTHVLCDRYKYSTLAYQHTQGLDLDDLIDRHKDFLIPDLIFFFDCCAEKAKQRQSYRDVFEQLEFQQQLRCNYLKVNKMLKTENIIVINSERSKSEIAAEVKTHVKNLFSN